MNLFPFQFHNVLDKKLITNDAGEFFLTSEVLDSLYWKLYSRSTNHIENRKNRLRRAVSEISVIE